MQIKQVLQQVTVTYSQTLGKWVLYTALSGIIRNQPGFDSPKEALIWAFENGYSINPILSNI
jgi:hypothetical protein